MSEAAGEVIDDEREEREDHRESDRDPEPEPESESPPEESPPEESAEIPDEMAGHMIEGPRADEKIPGHGDDSADVDTSELDAGEMYVNFLAVTTTSIRQRYGNDDIDRKETIDRYKERGREYLLDQYANEYAKRHGGIESMTPTQGIIVMTSMFAMTVAMEDPDAASGIADKLGF